MNMKMLLGATGVLLLFAIVLLCYWLWSWAGSVDSEGRRDGLTAQLMQRKTAATIEIRDGLAEASFRRAEQGLSKLRQIAETSAWFLLDAQYDALSDDFRDALDFLDEALSERDSTQLETAYANLVKSCVDCHRQTSRYQIDMESFRLQDAASSSGIFRPSYLGIVSRRVAYPKTVADWLILRSLRSKICLSPSPHRLLDRP